jgi:hypothetical protein
VSGCSSCPSSSTPSASLGPGREKDDAASTATILGAPSDRSESANARAWSAASPA